MKLKNLTQTNNLKTQKHPSKNLSKAFELLTQLPDDFFPEGRKDSIPQKRKSLRTYNSALSKTLSEWDSAEDDEAY